MRKLTIALCLIAALLVGSFPAPPALAANTYYVSVNDPNARDSSTYGSISKPWKTLNYAFQRLHAGDTLLVRDGTYTNGSISLYARNSGQPGAPVTVKAYPGEQVVVKSGGSIRFYGANWWTIDGLVFDNYRGTVLIGAHTATGGSQIIQAQGITIRNCEFRYSNKETIRIANGYNIVIEGNYIHHIRSGVTGKDLSTIKIPYMADQITIRNNRFEDIGADGLHLGNQGNKAGSNVATMNIIGNHFWINRPYTGPLGNVGENGIDLKWVKGPVTITGNVLHGFRPSTPQQDATGSGGQALVLQNTARNVTIERNLFYDNTTHVGVYRNKGNVPVQNVVIRNNIFRGARRAQKDGSLMGGYALQIGDSLNVQVYHNTFFDNDGYLSSWNTTSGQFRNNVVFKGSGSASGWQGDYNAWSQLSGSVPSSLRGSHDLSVSNLKLDANLRPLADSPVINAGQNLGVTNDFSGTSRSDGRPDLGAFEYIGASSASVPADIPAPTATETPTPVSTPTLPSTVTATPTYTPTLEPTSTVTPTLAPTSTVTPTGTPVLTLTPTATVTYTLTPTAIATDAAPPTSSPTDAPSSVPTLPGTPDVEPGDQLTPVISDDIALSPSPTVTATTTRQQ